MVNSLANLGPAAAVESVSVAPRVPATKLAEIVARKLEAEIVELGWPVGQLLGSEPELIDRLAISRAVFREAVRILEHDNIATMRRGPGGGLIITAPDASAAARATALTLEYMGASVQDLFVARSALELKCVELAADRVDEEGIEVLRAVCAAEAQSQAHGGSIGGHDVHHTIAQLSGNPAFVVFLDVLTKLTTQAISVGDRSTSIATDVRRAHDLISEAIIAKDSSLARHRMQSHLEAMAAWLSSSESGRAHH
jgi:DNA-binding FadR family transcriptional regulator